MKLFDDKDLIYKFASINEFTFKNLILSTLRFNPPNLMNDQLEGLIKIKNLDFKPTMAALENFIIENKFDKNYAEESIKEGGFIDFYMNNYWFNLELEKYGISCFSSNPIESLMWAHYANKHSGVCLIYDMEKLVSNLKEADNEFKVTTIQYGLMPTITLFEQNKKIEFESDLPIISAKNLNWKYENVIRFYFKNYGIFRGDSFFVGNSSLRGIIYGYQISEDDKDAISIIVRNDNKYQNVKEYNEVINFSTGEIFIAPE